MLLSVHNITSIEMSEIKELKNNGSKVRDITIRDEKGKVIELTLFADEAENLKVNKIAEFNGVMIFWKRSIKFLREIKNYLIK